MMAIVDIYTIVSTIENYDNRTATPIFVSNNSFQSTVTNKNSIKQTVIELAPIFPNSRITLFLYSNIQGNVTIICYGTNDKNWNSDLLKSLFFVCLFLFFFNENFIFIVQSTYIDITTYRKLTCIYI